MSAAQSHQLIPSYQDLFEDAPCGYVVLNLDGQIVQANAAFRELAKLDDQNATGASFRNLLGSAGAIFFDTQILPALLLSGRRKEIALDLRTAAGRVPVLVNFSVQYHQGRPEFIRAVLLDAAERRLFERNLLRSRKEAEQLAEVILHSSDAVVTSRVDGTIRNWNSGAAEMFGYSYTEATGSRLSELVLPADQCDSLQNPLRNLERGEEFSGEIIARRKDGSHFEASIKLTPHMEAPGTLVASSAVLRDISTQKRAERALLQNEKLAAVGRLASSIAHEINNPLEAVTNLLYLARTSAHLDEALPYLASADIELRRVGTIASQTLRFHRQSTRPMLSTFEELVRGILTGQHSRLNNSGVEVEERNRCAQPVICLEGEIRRVLGNLISNAIDAMHGRGGTLRIRGRDGRNWATGEKGMALTVADSGAGMSDHTRARVFEAFYTTKGISGTGLGLWISKEIIDRHHGTLSLRTRQQAPSGTIITLFLPANGIDQARPN